MVLSELNQEEIEFVELFEKKYFAFGFLEMIDNKLTAKGRKEKSDIKLWIDSNIDRFLSLTG